MQQFYTIKENTKLTDQVYRMVLQGDTSKITSPGQFVNIKIEPYYLRRPISICDYCKDQITIIYKVVGKGTEKLSQLPVSGQLDVLTGLGNGYDLTKLDKKVVLFGGGVGVPPMYGLAKKLVQQQHEVEVVLGFNRASEVFYSQEFEKLGCPTHVYTLDGSYGKKGLVTDAIAEYGYLDRQYCACGPLPMLKALVQRLNRGYLSLEARMGCGFGACMGCSIETKNGTKRVCKEGPVFESEELLWKD